MRGRVRPPERAPGQGELVGLATASGRTLAVEVREPRGLPRGTVVLAHAMMVSRSTFDRPAGAGLASFLVERGLRTVALDFRGHGGSGPGAADGADWSYDDLVREDVAAVCAAARDRWPKTPLTIVGHSLGGHVALAAAGTSALDVDRIVAVAANVWMPSHEPDRALRARKAASIAALAGTVRVVGRFPTRALGMGTDDEARTYFEQLVACWRNDAWTSRDGDVDYAASLASIRCPVLAVASVGDGLLCTPAAALRFLDRVPPSLVRYELVCRAADGGPAPGHMQLVTTRAAEAGWRRMADFCLGT